MHVAVAGASGATGQHVVEQAVEAGHRVTALVRDAGRYSAPDSAQVRQVDVVADAQFDLPADIDVVISALGKRSFKDTSPVCEQGVAHLLAAMQRIGIQRIIATSASPVLPSGAGEPWWFRVTMRPYVRWSGRYVYRDLERMETTLRAAGDWCDWTIVRPGFLLDASRPADYRVVAEANVRGTTRRPDLAAALLDMAGDPSRGGRAYGIASR